MSVEGILALAKYSMIMYQMTQEPRSRAALLVQNLPLIIAPLSYIYVNWTKPVSPSAHAFDDLELEVKALKHDIVKIRENYFSADKKIPELKLTRCRSF